MPEPTYTPPETVTIPGETAFEALALLDAYAEVAGGFRLDGEPDPFFQLENAIWKALMLVLGHPDWETDLDRGPVWDAMKERSNDLEAQIRSNFDGPALGALATTKMASDIAEVKARLEYVRA
jgi:hypothetical protein